MSFITYISSNLRLPRNWQRPGVALAGLSLLALAGGFQPAWSQAVGPEQLQIMVRQGGNVGTDVHLPGDKVGKTIVLQVLDERDLPQAGATLVFEARPGDPGDQAATAAADTGKKKKKKDKPPAAGAKPKELASVYFGDKDKTTVTPPPSDADGMVTVEKVFGNNVKGASSIFVTGSFENKKGSATIPQQNDPGPVCGKRCGIILSTTAAVTAGILYETLKPGPPTATGSTPTASTGK